MILQMHEHMQQGALMDNAEGKDVFPVQQNRIPLFQSQALPGAIAGRDLHIASLVLISGGKPDMDEGIAPHVPLAGGIEIMQGRDWVVAERHAIQESNDGKFRYRDKSLGLDQSAMVSYAYFERLRSGLIY